MGVHSGTFLSPPASLVTAPVNKLWQKGKKVKIKKWLISVAILTLALSTAGAITAFALTGDSEGDSGDGAKIAGDLDQGIPTYEEWLSKYGDTQGRVTSIDDIDPNVCNVVHNINACTPEELEAFRALTEIASVETSGETEPSVKGEVVATSIDDINPDVCNLVHNINACTPEDLEALSGTTLTDGEAASIGMCSPEVPDCTDYLVIPQGEDGELEHDSEVGDNPEPHFVDGEPGYVVQPLDEAIRDDCDLAGGTVYVTVEGELGCEVVHDLEDSADEQTTSSQPPAVEPEPVPAPR